MRGTCYACVKCERVVERRGSRVVAGQKTQASRREIGKRRRRVPPALPVDIGRLHYEEVSIQSIYHHTPADVAEKVRQLVAGEVPVERLITARLPLSELRTALQMVADRTALRTILVPEL